MNQIQEKIALASRLRDVNPQEALDIVGAVRSLLQAPESQGDAESVMLWRAECALNAAWAHVRLGQFAAAYPEAEEGLRLFKQQGKLQGVAGCLLVTGIAKGEDGKNDEAVKLCLEAEALFLKAGDQFGRARAINACGISYRRLGDSAQAIEAFGTSMAVARDNGDSQGMARALCNVGYVYLYEKKFEQAIENSQRALMMERDLGNLAAELSNCCNLVQALVGAGRAQEAIDFMASYDLERLSKSGLFSFLELSLSLATAYMETGRSADAEVLLKMGIERARRDGNLRELASLLCTFARLQRIVHLKDGVSRAHRLAAARSALEEALTHGHSRDLDYAQGTHEEFCALCREEGRWNEAFEHIEEAHRIALKLSAASADERLARQRSEQEAADQRRRADAEAQKHKIELKLREMQRLESLGVMSRGIAHDFNNILTAILGNTSLASLELPTGSPVQDCLKAIRQSSLRAAELCKQMLAYSGAGRFDMKHLSLNQLIQENTQLVELSISNKAALRFNLDPALPLIGADATQIQQVIINLIINGSEAIGENDGVIEVNTGVTLVDRAFLSDAINGAELPEGRYVHLEVSDSGCGMSPETQAKIFDPFFTTKFTGRGLGLAAVLGIVRRHKGALKVISAPGRGTTFRLVFPVGDGDAETPALDDAAKTVGR